jgi:16S rRNA (cytosine1402-N4)-methyltransferase
MTSGSAPQLHEPVLLAEVLAAARGAQRVVDATVGHGGHSGALRMDGVAILAIDRDPDALATARARLGSSGMTWLETPYASPDAIEAVTAFRPDFILLDLGVSSRQLDADGRGFSFRPGIPLDMRMSGSGVTAADLLNGLGESELQAIFRDYADERRAAAMAREVVRRRERSPFSISDDLVNVVRSVLGPRSGPGEFARVFQGLRIAVNDELGGLALALDAFRDALVPGGRLAVISYHSGEDRLVKQAFRDWSNACTCPPGLPVCICGGRARGMLVTRRPIVASDAEAQANPRARSARLRIFQVTDAG